LEDGSEDESEEDLRSVGRKRESEDEWNREAIGLPTKQDIETDEDYSNSE